MTAISLVVSTRNRAEQLVICLCHIKALRTSAPWELIIVDNGSSDSTADLLQEYVRSVFFPITVLREPIPGLGRARNRGWQAATGDIIAFTDDDCYVAPNFLDEALNAFDNPKLGYCGGRIKLYDTADYPITIYDSDVAEVFPPYRYIPAGAIQGANMMFRRKVLAEIGGFDDALGAGTPFPCEDIDACARATYAGWWGAYRPGPTVLHAHGRKASDVPALRRRYAIGRGAYAAKFILRHDTRRCYLRAWCRVLARHLKRPRTEWRECLQEMSGATLYCLRNFF